MGVGGDTPEDGAEDTASHCLVPPGLCNKPFVTLAELFGCGTNSYFYGVGRFLGGPRLERNPGQICILGVSYDFGVHTVFGFPVGN